MTTPLTPEERVKLLPVGHALAEPMRSMLIATIREAEQAAWRRGAEWMRRRAIFEARDPAKGNEPISRIVTIAIPEEEP